MASLVMDVKGNIVDFQAAASYMDSEITESMLAAGYDSDDDAQAFFEEYAVRHADKYEGEEFAPYFGLAW